MYTMFCLIVGPPFVFPFLYSSYGEQQRDELYVLFDEITKSDAKVPILLGDFNHGPTGPGDVQDTQTLKNLP